jgi:tRNA threonylcarbamoyladenosine biosynthesis protein TsaE
MRNLSSMTLCDLAATRTLGRRVSMQLVPGDIVFLIGDLGAGKTTLARTIIQELCGVEEAPSPTYTIVQTYDTHAGGQLWHADLYRIEDVGEIEQLGLEDAYDGAITLMEWPDRLGNQQPASRLEIRLTPKADGADTARDAIIVGFGDWESRIDNI